MQFFGFALEGCPDPDDLDLYQIPLRGFRLTDPAGTDPKENADLNRAMQAMGPPRMFRLGPDESFVEIDSL